MRDLWLGIAIASIAGCVFGEYYVDSKKTAEQMCVQRAITNADRIACMNAKSATEGAK